MSIRRSVVPTPLAFAIAALLAVAACGGSATPAPASVAPSTAPAASAPAASAPAASAPASPSVSEPSAEAGQPSAEASQPVSDDGGGLSGAAARLSNMDSYKFKIVMTGGSFGSLLGTEPITGTVTTNPKAAHMSMMGMEIIEVDGKTWVKLGTAWTESTDDSTSSLADSFSPDKMFGSTLSGSAAAGYKAVGEEQKNGVTAVHYTADATVLGTYGSLFGVEGNATWSADVWVAKDGGFPVSMSVLATGGTEEFKMIFDVTDINSPSNKIESPA